MPLPKRVHSLQHVIGENLRQFHGQEVTAILEDVLVQEVLEFELEHPPRDVG